VLARAKATLDQDPRIADIVEPQPGATLSKDGTTAVLLAGANADPNEMVRVADDVKGPLQALSTAAVQVNPTGASLRWSDFNEEDLDAMLKSEMLSWPVTLAILRPLRTTALSSWARDIAPLPASPWTCCVDTVRPSRLPRVECNRDSACGYGCPNRTLWTRPTRSLTASRCYDTGNRRRGSSMRG